MGGHRGTLTVCCKQKRRTSTGGSIFEQKILVISETGKGRGIAMGATPNEKKKKKRERAFLGKKVN